MEYLLGVDLGTTYSAAAIAEDGRVEIVPLGSRTATIPSVVALRADGVVLTGEAAERRGVTEPARVAREFKRRLGDPIPIVIGGTPYGAETLMAHLLRGIVDDIAEQQGTRPTAVALSHPATYGPYKLDLLEQVGHLAELDRVEFITEPQAAAIHHSGLERIEAGDVVAVYDLGGGTFDAALVRRTDGGFELLGTPEGLERFGGIDLDQAVFDHVRRSLGRAAEGLDPGDPAVTSALARLRDDCRAAKEGLSADTDVAVPVMLPGLHTEVRLTRAEFEDMIRPRLRETVATLQRVVRGAGLELADLSRVLLVGGSSRIPLVAEMVREATGVPVGLGAHPKHAIALGAATAAEAGATRPSARSAAAVPAPEEEAAARPDEVSAAAEPPEGEPAARGEEAAPLPAPAGEEAVEPREPEPSPEKRPVERPGTPPRRGLRVRLVAAVAALVVIAAAVLGVVFLGGDGDGDPEAASTTEAAATTESTVADTEPATTPATTPEATETTVPATEPEPPPGDGLPPVEGPDPSPLVVVSYTTSLMVPDARGEWGTWAAAEGAAPPDDIASDYYPALGLYDSADPAVLAQHLAWIRRAGIGTVAVLWAGPESPGAAVMPPLLELLEHYGLSFALVFPGFERSPGEFLELAVMARELYGEHPQWLRVSARGIDEPRRVVFMGLPEGFAVDIASWTPVLEEVRAQGLAVIAESPEPVWIEAGADGLLFEDLERSFEWARELPGEALYVPVVSPGRSAERIGEPELSEERRSGAQYREDWELAHVPRPPDGVFVYSFNHWPDGSQIEPARPDVPERGGIPYRSYEPLAPEDYLFLTAELVDAFGYR